MIGRIAPGATMQVILALATSACGGKVLELGFGIRDDPSNYATSDDIAAEADAGFGVPTIMARHQHTASAVSVDDTRIYWLVDVRAQGSPAYARSCVKTNCAGTLVNYPKDAPEMFANGIRKTASNRTHLYWNGIFHRYETAPRVVACPIAGCAPDPIEILATYDVRNFLVDDDAFFALLQNGNIVRCPATGCQRNPTVLAMLTRTIDDPSASAFAADNDNLYWIEGARLVTNGERDRDDAQRRFDAPAQPRARWSSHERARSGRNAPLLVRKPRQRIDKNLRSIDLHRLDDEHRDWPASSALLRRARLRHCMVQVSRRTPRRPGLRKPGLFPRPVRHAADRFFDHRADAEFSRNRCNSHLLDHLLRGGLRTDLPRGWRGREAAAIAELNSRPCDAVPREQLVRGISAAS